ncbi:MAG: hypothetical protein JXK16_09460 [Thiotrichales bacterium]|nr:hypothetical protein [Thiotrichales bacterium]
MPGSNHDVDPSFMDALPFSVRDAALDLIRFSSLREMLEMHQNGPTDFLKNNFDLTPQQWNQVLNTVILTKISYFQISLLFPNVYIDKLLEIAAFAYGTKGANPAELYQSMLNQHPQFAEWIKECLLVKQQKARILNNKARMAKTNSPAK